MKNENKPLAKVFHAEIQGKRNEKYEYLLNNSIASVQWNEINHQNPYYFYVNLEYSVLAKYDEGFQLSNIFKNYNSGIQTKNDPLTIKHSIIEIEEVVNCFKSLNIIELSNRLGIKDSAGWKIQNAKDDIIKNKGKIINIQYRLFDLRKTYFTGKSSGFIGRTRGEVMNDMANENIAIIFKRTGKIYGSSFDFFFLSKYVISEGLFAIDPLGREYLAPLYHYPDAEKDGMYANAERTPNLNMEIVNKIAEGLGLEFVPEKLDTVGTGRDLSLQDGNSSVQTTFAPIDILDYIYAVLHSPTYRETYKEFLKIDFPRVPYPHSLGTGRDLSLQKFWKLVQLGGEIRQIHLLESPIVEDYITEYPEDGTNEVEKIKYVPNVGTGRDLSLHDGKVYINSTQYFDNVPEVAWNFYIGGYQPAQKWLKDRKGRILNFDDILHYQKIIVALTETDRLMKAVDEVMKVEGE